MKTQPYRFVVRATQSIAHGEAGVNSTGPNNTTLFARELALLNREQISASDVDVQASIDQLLRVALVPASSVEFLTTLTGGELLAVIFASQFPMIYRGEGEGLFAGAERYQYLTTRLVDAATCCSTLPTAWAYVSRKLSLSPPGSGWHPPLLALFSLPPFLQSAALAATLRAPEMIVMGARFIADGMKTTSWRYAEAVDRDTEEGVIYEATEEQVRQLGANDGRMLAVRIPAISGNSIRHNLLRAPGATRLLTELGLTPDREIVPIAVERFLYSGGNTVKGARAPGACDLYEAVVRRNYPFIDALGGSFDQFLLTRSNVSVASWIVCRENNWITASKTDGQYTSDVSIFDLVSEVTRTRSGIGGKDKESGQMIFSYETLAAQTAILIEVSFQPYTSDLTIGAVMQAIDDWQGSGGTLGAKSAQGHSGFIAEHYRNDVRQALAAEYLSYLAEHRDRLRQGLIDATFGTEAVLCGA